VLDDGKFASFGTRDRGPGNRRNGEHRAPAMPELQRFAAVVKTTLAGLKRMLRGQKITSPEMPDLRNDCRVLLEAGDQRFYPYTLANIEGDTIVNSVNTLRDQILRWPEQLKSLVSFAGQSI
jgi:hypothetical protein